MIRFALFLSTIWILSSCTMEQKHIITKNICDTIEEIDIKKNPSDDNNDWIDFGRFGILYKSNNKNFGVFLAQDTRNTEVYENSNGIPIEIGRFESTITSDIEHACSNNTGKFWAIIEKKAQYKSLLLFKIPKKKHTWWQKLFFLDPLFSQHGITLIKPTKKYIDCSVFDATNKLACGVGKNVITWDVDNLLEIDSFKIKESRVAQIIFDKKNLIVTGGNYLYIRDLRNKTTGKIIDISKYEPGYMCQRNIVQLLIGYNKNNESGMLAVYKDKDGYNKLWIQNSNQEQQFKKILQTTTNYYNVEVVCQK